MKKIYTLFWGTIIFCHQTFGQQNISDLTATTEEATAELFYLFDLNVISYYELDYDTDLEISVFKKSEEYQNKLSELKKIKAETLNTPYYLKETGKFTWYNTYNMKRSGFEIDLVWWGEKAPKSFYLSEALECRVQLKALPTKQATEGSCREVLFIPMSETDGLEVTNDIENIDIYYFFSPKGIERITSKLLCPGIITWENNSNYITANSVRIVVANNTTGKIYYDKSYSYQPPAPKK